MRRIAALVLAAALVAGCHPPADGLLTSPADLASTPTSGPSWDATVATARGSWGSPNLGDNNSRHDTNVLAGAIVATRLDDDGLRAKVRAAIDAVMVCDCYARVLELSRNVPGYVLAADLVGLPAAQDARFRDWLAGLRTKPLQGHSGGHDLRSTAVRSANNWGTMARAAMAAIDLYLDDRSSLASTVTAHRGWLGDPVDHDLSFTSTDWHATADKAGINRRGATIGGRNVDGVIPEDQRRTGDFQWPAPKGSYPWEALQGAVLTGVLLHRAGVLHFDAGDDALVRAATWLHDVNGNPAEGDDLNTPWVLNHYGGTTFPTAKTSPAKNLCCMDVVLAA